MSLHRYTPSGRLPAPPEPGAAADPARNAADVAALADRFGQRLRVFAARRLGDATEAEDVAQETLRRVLDALVEGRLRDPDALPAFVFRTATHVCQQHHRSRGRQRQALELYGRVEADDRGSAPDALTRLITDERRAAVRDALDRLSLADRTLLRSFFYEGLEAADIATREGTSVTAIRVRKHRALRRLERILERGT